VTSKKSIHVRFTEQEDSPLLKSWLLEPGVLRWFPMINEKEVEDAVRVWMNYAKLQACLTVEWEGTPCGMANLYIQPYKKMAHQCLFAIVISEPYRGKGVGTVLLTELMALAKEKFHVEFLHLEVYEHNPAMKLYKRLGFVEYGRHPHFIKDHGGYVAKVMMQRDL
jgi:putative acetyltransferase